LLGTPNISYQFSDDTSIIPKLQVENTLYYKYIYTHSKGSVKCTCTYMAYLGSFQILFSFLSLGPYMGFYSYQGIHLFWCIQTYNHIFLLEKILQEVVIFIGRSFILKIILVWDFYVALHGFSESHNCIFWFMPLARFII
jgi:hypothetical protein